MAAQTPGRIPFPNRVNDQLPAWLRLRGEFRERIESVAGASFTSEGDDVYWLTRVRVNTTISPGRLLSFQVQVQDARVAGKNIGPGGPPFSGPIDVRTSFVDVGSATTRAAARVGRQELAFGEQRLVGHASWLNTARTFDAARVTLRQPGVQFDLFAASVVRVLSDEWDRSGNGNHFYGAYASATSLLPRTTIEPYFFWRGERDMPTGAGSTAALRLATTGVRWNGALPAGFDYGFETAIQSGSLGSDDVSAWAWHSQLRTPSFGPTIRVTSEYNYASGDDAAGDGRRNTFDQLYPTAHDKYGLADQVGWRNVHHIRASVDASSIRGLPVSAAWHTWWIASTSDALYAASGVPIARLPAGESARHVGQELDIQATRSLRPYLQVAGGFAHIWAGSFLKAATPGASYSSAFLMLTYVFLAER